MKKRRAHKRQLAFILGSCTALVAPFLIYVWGHVEIVKTGYEMETIDQRIAALKQENRALRLERARLLELSRIEREARSFGLEPLHLSRLLVVEDPTTRSRR